MNKPTVTHWNTSKFSQDDRYDAWVVALSDNYGMWNSARPKGSDFYAKVERLHNGSMTLIKCVCDPCEAQRPQRMARAKGEEFAAFQLVLSGQEQIELDDKRFQLARGDIFVWDSTREMTFDVTSRLSKLSLIMPLDQFRRWLPDDWRCVTGKLQRDSISHRLLQSYLSTMMQPQFGTTEFCGNSVLDAALAILSGGIQSDSEERTTVGRLLLQNIKKYVRLNLANPELCLSGIADYHGISIRYLHWLFSRTDASAARYILEERLKACRADLENPMMASKSVSDIAFRWGFNNASHFTRRYKEKYGQSPSDTRRSLR